LRAVAADFLIRRNRFWVDYRRLAIPQSQALKIALEPGSFPRQPPPA